jgi:nitrite reductase/ring-hydroxylating ferredoxin subunit
MSLIEVCAVSDLDDSVPKVITVGRIEVVLAKWRGEIFALRNVCPHQSQSFERGLIRASIGGPHVGEVSIDDENPVLLCPWHTWPFSLRTGKCAVDPKLAV